MKESQARQVSTRRNAPRPGPRDARVAQTAINFRRIVTMAKRHFHAQEKSELSGAQLWALWHVNNTPGLTVMDLSGKLSIHQSTASNLIEKLESGGHLRRSRSTEDKRVVQLFVTASGAQTLQRLPEPTQGVVPNAISRLSETELATVEKAIGLLTREFLGSKAKSGARNES